MLWHDKIYFKNIVLRHVYFYSNANKTEPFIYVKRYNLKPVNMTKRQHSLNGNHQRHTRLLIRYIINLFYVYYNRLRACVKYK